VYRGPGEGGAYYSSGVAVDEDAMTGSGTAC
jgi:hypothetical protein